MALGQIFSDKACSGKKVPSSPVQQPTFRSRYSIPDRASVRFGRHMLDSSGCLTDLFDSSNDAEVLALQSNIQEYLAWRGLYQDNVWHKQLVCTMVEACTERDSAPSSISCDKRNCCSEFVSLRALEAAAGSEH